MMDNNVMNINESLACYKTVAPETVLVDELWALRDKCDKKRADEIAEQSHIPLKWIDKAPSPNGEKGIEKLLAERGVLLLRNRTSPFIEQFQHPIGRCAKFYKLTAYNNCNFWCEYCYLYLTFRTNPISTHFVNYEKMFKEIIAFDKSDIPDTLRVLNLGELCDPLAVEDITGFAEKLIPFVAERTAKTRLLFLTKGDNIEGLLRLHHDGKSIMSFSVNTDKVYRHLEHRTAPPEARLLAAQQLQKAGYEIRLRIDPIIIYEGWQEDYIGLVDTIFRYVQPTRITIGEYRPSRGLVSHIGSRFPESTLLRINDGLVSDGTKLRYPEKKRVAAFRAIIDRIRQQNAEIPLSLCKENPAIWKQLDMMINGLHCNCLG
jgi:spore photoproduct lyase